MLSYALYLYLLIYISPNIPVTATAATTPAYTASDFILLNCGDSSTLNDLSGRSWAGDERSKYASSNSVAISSRASYMDPSVFDVPYKTARFFHTPFTYSFPVVTGPKFLRLYFYPNIYSDFNASKSFFSVTANAFTLLSNFSAYLYSKNSSRPSFMREFILHIDEKQSLDLTFSPNPDSFAFVNGIEIVACPDMLYFQGNYIRFQDQLFFFENSTVLENLYRLNVGGAHVDINDDTGMFRAWSPDDDYIFGEDYGYSPHLEVVQISYTAGTPPYSAPAIVYTTARVTGNTSVSLDWVFPVDSGFYYLLRLHFCEFTKDVRAQNQRVFTININNQTKDYDYDVIMKAGGPDIPIFKDYIAWIPDDGRRGKQDLRLSLYPDRETNPKYYSALLNGLETFKLSDSNRSLAAANPELAKVSSNPTLVEKPPEKKSRGSTLIYVATGCAIGVVAVVAMSALIYLRCRKMKDSVLTSKSWVLLSSRKSSGSGSGASLPSNICRYFSLDEIKIATRNFDDDFVIGEGGFGKVYKGLIDDGTTTVAIKRLSQSSSQGVHEFLTEIKMLSKLRHLNLVSLIGYCDAYGEMILVYDYMAHGTLRSHLYNSQHPPLTWSQRLQICVAAAKGLHYLHAEAEQSIIHRDVKTSNILLDDKWVAKMSDFGLSKVGPTGGDHTHVSTVVKGSSGYVDPEYYRRRQLTEKSDVYSFGVVLFEVLSGRPAVVQSLPRGEANLAEWGQCCYLEGRIEQIVDANLNGQITAECLNKFGETAAACVRRTGIERPAMNDVVWSLEFASQLQEAAESEGGICIKVVRRASANSTDTEMFSRSSEQVAGSKSSEFSTGDVFSHANNQLDYAHNKLHL